MTFSTYLLTASFLVMSVTRLWISAILNTASCSKKLSLITLSRKLSAVKKSSVRYAFPRVFFSLVSLCQASYAHVQGLDANLKYLKCTRVGSLPAKKSVAELFAPMVFVDGRDEPMSVQEFYKLQEELLTGVSTTSSTEPAEDIFLDLDESEQLLKCLQELVDFSPPSTPVSGNPFDIWTSLDATNFSTFSRTRQVVLCRFSWGKYVVQYEVDLASWGCSTIPACGKYLHHFHPPLEGNFHFTQWSCFWRVLWPESSHVSYYKTPLNTFLLMFRLPLHPQSVVFICELHKDIINHLDVISNIHWIATTPLREKIIPTGVSTSTFHPSCTIPFTNKTPLRLRGNWHFG